MDYKTKLRSALDLFVSDDDTMPQFKLPFIQGDYVFATNGHILVGFRHLLLGDLKFNTKYDLPDCLSLIFEKENTNIIFETQKLRSAVSRSKKALEKAYVMETITCPDCDGRGFVDFIFKDLKSIKHAVTSSCPTCEESGQISITIESLTGRIIDYFIGEYLSLDGVIFKTASFEKIVRLSEMLEQKTIKLVCGGQDKKLHKFIVSECVVCIMPVIEVEQKDVVTKIYKPK